MATIKIGKVIGLNDLLPIINHYGVCSTPAGTAEKTASLAGFALVEGARITVNFTTPNTVSSPTLNVNGTGAVAMKCKTRTTGLVWQAEIMTLVYDGTSWCIIGGYSLSDKPVGSHSVQYQGESTPAALYGGTWTLDPDYAGRVLVGAGTGFTLGATGGSETHTLQILELAEHAHQGVRIKWNDADIPSNANGLVDGDGRPLRVSTNLYQAHVSVDYPNNFTENTGNSTPFSLMQPYKVVGVWKRIT